MKKRLQKKKTVRPLTNDTDKTMKIAICIFLVAATLAVYWQIQDHEFLYFDDNQYVTDNLNVKAGVYQGKYYLGIYHIICCQLASNDLAFTHAGLSTLWITPQRSSAH